MEELRILVTRARRGDLDAYGEVVGRLQDMAYGYAYSILGDFHLAEDAAQEAFIEAYRDLPKLKEPAAFVGWLRRIVQRRCGRLTRGRRIPTVPLDAAGGLASAEEGPGPIAEARERTEAVLAGIRSLPGNERTATTLFYIGGYSHEQIADFLDVPTGTVKSRLHAARKRLKERMTAMVGSTLKSFPLPERFADVIVQMEFVAERVNPLGERMRALTDGELREKSDELRGRLAAGDPRDQIKAEAFALVREATRRAHNQPHYDVQLVAGMFLDEGWIAEEPAGEGKTITSYPAAYMAVLEGKRVHVVTVNDYLVKRDAAQAGDVFSRLGVTVGHITADLPAGGGERTEACECDIIYGTGVEFAFDYLYDTMSGSDSRPVRNSLDLAIIDEADSFLIDEAGMTLALAGEASRDVGRYRGADAAARQLIRQNGTGVDESGPERRHLVDRALRAHRALQKDRDYIVRDGKVVVVDQFIGRALENRQWSEGLHQAVECKEGVPITPERKVLASIRLGEYFKQYRKLAGLTGTGKPAADGLREQYQLEVMTVPTRLENRGTDHEDRVYVSGAARCEAVLQEIVHHSRELGRPVLVATTSIPECDRVSKMLQRAGIEHEVLNARPENVSREARTIAAAGRVRPAQKNASDAAGPVTVATSMAGRGTDISLDEHARGGLHVIGVGRHAIRRIDDQLSNRAARQGAPGSARFFLSADDPLIAPLADQLQFDEAGFIEDRRVSRLVERAQLQAEKHHFQTRDEYVITRPI